MQNLVLDFGNTAVKVAVFEDSTIISHATYQVFSVKELEEILQNFTEIEHCIFSTVVILDKYLRTILFEKLNGIELTHHTKLPLKNCYQTPETLGKDRLSAAVGAHSIFFGINVLTIDAGTALKFDFVNSRGEYLGGSISPGMRLRFQSLHTFTDKLPLVPWQDFNNLIGTTTQESILSGVINGFVSEIDGMINNYKSEYPDLKVILTGGESIYFEKLLKNSIFAVPNLVLIGLYEILKFNEEKN